MKLLHKPTVVDAVLWADDNRSHHELLDLGYLADNDYFVYEDRGATVGTRTLLVPTAEGVRPARAGEYWVIRGVRGEWYAIPNDVKAAAYTEVA